MLKVDSHQHFWIFDPVRDSWITDDMSAIRRDFMPADLKVLLNRHNIAACVTVQADQSEAETMFLLQLAEDNDFIKGIVGWVDLHSSDLDERLEYYKEFPKLKGFRHIIQAEEPGFMLDPVFLKGIAALTNYNFTYDVLVRSSQIKEAVKLAELNPRQRFVLDHLGKPPIKTRSIREWAADIKQLAARENVYCKLSGVVTEADHTNWKAEDFHPYLDIVFEAFGTKRVMFGSDWPVCNLAADYSEVSQIIATYCDKLNDHERELIWAGNAVEFYKLDIY